MNRYIKITSIILFLVLIVIMPISYYTIKNVYKDDEEMIKKIDIDLNENRKLEELEYENITDFPNAFEKYFNDHIPFRSYLILFNRKINSKLEKIYLTYVEDCLLSIYKTPTKKVTQYDKNEIPMDREVKIFRGHALSDKEKDIVKNPDTDFPYKERGKTVVGRNNWLFFSGDNIDCYKGTNLLNEKEMDTYVKALVNLNELCEKNNKKLIYLVIPEKDRVYNEYMPTLDIEDSEGRIQKIKDVLASKSNANYIYPVKELKDKKENYRVYAKYDTHYTSAGAYVVHNEILKALNMEIIDIDDINLDKKGEPNRELIALANLDPNDFTDDFDYNIKYKEEVECKTIYEEKKSPDVNYWIDSYESNSPNEQNVLFYGDSFKEKMKPILNKDFKNSFFLGCFSEKGKRFEDAVKNSDVIIIENVERFEKELFISKVQEISKILKNKAK